MSCKSSSTKPGWVKEFVCKLYKLILCFYPSDFRSRFNSEMEEVFTFALDENLQRGPLWTFVFLFKEFATIPKCAIIEYLPSKPGNLLKHPIVVCALYFCLGSAFLGLIETMREIPGGSTNFYWLHSLGVFFAGSLGNIGVGITLINNKKSPYAISGAIFFLSIYAFITPIAASWPPGIISTIIMMISVLRSRIFYLIFFGIYWGVFIALANKNWKSLFRFGFLVSLAFLFGLFLNRFSAAIFQSILRQGALYSYSSYTNMGLFLIVFIPYFLEGILSGALIGLSIRRYTSVST